MGRGKAVRIINLPRPIREQYRRALQLEGSGSQSRDLLTHVRRTIRQAQEKFGEDLFQVLTAEESDLLAVIESGAAEVQHIAEETLLPLARVEVLLKDLESRKIVEKRKKGGKTAVARGAAVNLYFIAEKYKSSRG
jgi:hypothetical protein